jgi:hypothetical protein
MRDEKSRYQLPVTEFVVFFAGVGSAMLRVLLCLLTGRRVS